jgi:DNA-directed RNA polymerase specialized sigma24 family protein
VDTDLDSYLTAIVAGDADAFGRWLARAEGPLRNSLRPFATAIDAEAVLQETLLRVWQVAPRFVPDGKSNGLLRLAHRMARNLAISEVRRAKLAPVGVDNLEEYLNTHANSDCRPLVPDPILQRTIGTCREQLPEKPAQALSERLRNAGSEPDEVLATRLGMKLNTFLQNFSRARKLLADCLKARGVELEAEVP